MGELATYELEGRVATIAMDDGKVNALSIEMLKTVMAALDRAEADGAVVLLTGRDKYFSAGFDLKVFSERPGEIVEMLTLGARLSERLLSFPTPVVVACNGHAIAAGTFPALAADLRIGVEGPYRSRPQRGQDRAHRPPVRGRARPPAAHAPRLQPLAGHGGDVRPRGGGRSRLPRPGRPGR